uniref:BTB/POZ and TAZ domain-containing protein 2 n=1 Tax=Rhizophora mucronata TaxID=61149 RepID=A0A2P2JXX7_RHIMU
MSVNLYIQRQTLIYSRAFGGRII